MTSTTKMTILRSLLKNLLKRLRQTVTPSLQFYNRTRKPPLPTEHETGVPTTEGQRLMYCFFRRCWKKNLSAEPHVSARWFIVELWQFATDDCRAPASCSEWKHTNCAKAACRPSFSCSCCCFTTRCNVSYDLPALFTLLRSTKQMSQVPIPNTVGTCLQKFYKSQHYKLLRFFNP